MLLLNQEVLSPVGGIEVALPFTNHTVGENEIGGIMLRLGDVRNTERLIREVHPG